MEFLQRCVFPRLIFSATDAAYCAAFVRMLHTLGTPFFNTFEHINLLICKLLQPMICCCTELEAGRFGRFLCETLRMAYDWKVFSLSKLKYGWNILILVYCYDFTLEFQICNDVL